MSATSAGWWRSTGSAGGCHHPSHAVVSNRRSAKDRRVVQGDHAHARNGEATASAPARPLAQRRVEEDLEFHWQLVEGPGELTGVHDQAVTFLAQEEPGLARVRVTVRQREVVCVGEGLVTVTHELLTQLAPTTVPSQGLPGYTLERAPGESWRSKFDIKRNVIVVNNGHRDFVFASRSRSLKLRYLVRLYAKELVMHNFAGLSADQLLERMIELSLRTEEHL